MASKKRSLRDHPPSASSSSSESDEELGAEGGVEEENEEISVPVSPRRVSGSQSFDEDGDESATESDEEPDEPNGKQAPENVAVEANGVEGPASKRVRLEAVPEGVEKPKPGQERFQRIWSESDEIEIMKGLVEFNDRKKVDSVLDFNDLYEFLRGKIPTFFSKQQLTGKMGTMKKRFMSCENRAKNKKKLRPLDEIFLELARKAWGSVENLGNDKNKKKMNNDAAIPDAMEKEGANASVLSRWLSKELSRMRGEGAVEEGFIRKGMDLMSESELSVFHQRWMRLQNQELRIATERVSLIKEMATLVSGRYNFP